MYRQLEHDRCPVELDFSDTNKLKGEYMDVHRSV